METLTKKMEALEKEIEELAKKAALFDTVKPDMVPKPKDDNLLEVFRLVKLNDPMHSFQYKTTRCQKRNAKSAMKNILKKFPLAKIVLDIAYVPNAANIQHRLKQSLSKDDDIIIKGNEIEVSDYDVENMLIDNIKDIASTFL